MSKKRAKSGSAGGARWEQGLLQAVFADDTWNANITFLVGNKLDDYKHVEVLEGVVRSGTRRLFTIVSKHELFEEVKDLGNAKGKKTKETPAHADICESVKPYIDNDDEIPLPLLAKLLKFKLLWVKSNDLKRRDVEKKAAADKEKAAKGGGKRERSKSPKKGGKKTPEPPPPKPNSKLRKRGEEDPDGKYIDDEPDDGPQHYILIYGFNHPHLPTYMAELGLNIDAVVKVTSESYERFKPPPPPEDQDEEEIPMEKDEKTLALEEEARLLKEKQLKELTMFWRDILPIMRSQQQVSKLHDVAMLDYIVQENIIPESLEDVEKKTEFGTSMFEDVACMLYDLYDFKRQYKNYLDNMKLIHVPVFGEPPQPAQPPAEGQPPEAVKGAATPTQAQVPTTLEGTGPVQTEVDTRYYNDLMNVVPQESVSVALVMHCMLEQIVATEEEREPPSEVPPSARSDGLDNRLASYISGMAFKLSLKEEERSALADEFDIPATKQEGHKEPLLMNFWDNINSRTHHLKSGNGLNPKEAELKMLQYLPFTELVQVPQPDSKEAKERAARLQELIYFCATGGLTESEIDRAFKQFVFECMDLTEIDEEAYIVSTDPLSAIPWDDPYPFFKGMVSKQADANEDSIEEDFVSLTESLDSLDELLTPSILCDIPSDIPEPHPRPPSPSPHDPDSSLFSPSPERKPYSRSNAEEGKAGSRPQSAGSGAQSGGSRPQSANSYPGSGEGSRPTTPGILKTPAKPGSATSARSSHSVHFERDEDGNPIPSKPIAQKAEEEEKNAEPNKTLEESMNEIVDSQKRQLDEWCFAEHFEPHVLLQVLQRASYVLPYVDTYYHKRDQSLLVVLHNPFNSELQNHTDWSAKVHSNVGFRNYLEHVSDYISDWTKEEEAKHQAKLLEAELVKIRAEEEAASKAGSETGKKGRGKSPRGRSARSKSPKGSRSGSQERPGSASSNPFIRAGSLKAQKEEMDRLRAEALELERQKEEKRAKSAQKRRTPSRIAAEAAAAKAEKEKEEAKKKRPGSRGSARSRKSNDGAKSPAPSEDETPKEPERFWPFIGYDVANDLVQASGVVSHLFPADGGQIRTERIDFEQGVTSVKTSVHKNGHVFTVHVLDPKEPGSNVEETKEEKVEEKEKAELEKSEKEETASQGEPDGDVIPPPKEDPPVKPSVSRFGSFSAVLNDGMNLAFSVYGGTGVPPDGKKPEPEPYNPPPPRSPSPTNISPAKGKKGDKGKDKDKAVPTPEPVVQEEEPKEEVVEEEKPIVQQFQQLYITCPDGLNIKYMLESHVGITPADDNDRHVLIKQSYPFKTNGVQPCEGARKNAMKELSRVITTDGSVVRSLQNGSTMVLCADGTTKHITGSGSFVAANSRVSSPQRFGSAKTNELEKPTSPKKGGKRKSAQQSSTEKQLQEQLSAEEDKKSSCITIAPTGERTSTHADGKTIPMKPLLTTFASDPETKQTLTSREDHVMIIQNPDGRRVVQHSDGTRITTYYVNQDIYNINEDTGEMVVTESTSVQHLRIECPGFATVTYNTHTGFWETKFGSGSMVVTSPKGSYEVMLEDGGKMEVDEEGTALYFPPPNNNLEFMHPGQQQLLYVMKHHADVVCETVDNEGNVFNVKHDGETVVMTPKNNTVNTEEKQVSDELIQEKNVRFFKQHAPRFFIIHANGSGTELLRYQDVADYLSAAEADPATAVIKEPIVDYPGVTGITILKPYTRGQSERWFTTYEDATIIPHGLRSRDLSTLPSKEVKKEGPKFGVNVGQGLAVGSAPPPRPAYQLLKCPPVLELRQLVQYKPMNEDLRTRLWDSLKEYAEFVRDRNQTSQELMVKDPRPAEEQSRAAELQESVKPRETISVGTIEGNLKDMYQQATAPPVPSPPPTPKPKRTAADWERDRREVAQELEGREALRSKKIPPYFQSEMGKAFLMTQAPDMESLSKELAEDPRRDGHQALRSNSATPVSEGRNSAPPPYQPQDFSNPSVSSNSQRPVEESPSPGQPMAVASVTPSNLRPGNPTPAHATGQGSPSPLRPKNPTPAHANKSDTERPGNPTPKQSNGPEMPTETPSSYWSPTNQPIAEQPIAEEIYDNPEAPSAGSEIILTRSLQVDVIGQPRKEQVKVPAYIKGGRPSAFPNQRFNAVEEPVRRQVKTSSVSGATIKGQSQLIGLRGLELLPDKIDFGVLREGYTYNFIVLLKNTGVDSCRYKIRQPPPSTGLKVIYLPGPIAAGMKAELVIEIYAIAVGVEGESGMGMVSHDLEIITETDQLFLPISAMVMTAADYDQSSPRGRKAPGVKLVSTRPPAGQGIIRPRKDQRADPEHKIGYVH